MTQKQPKPLLFCYFGFEMQSQPQRARGVHLQARDVGALACLLPPVVCLHTHVHTHTFSSWGQPYALTEALLSAQARQALGARDTAVASKGAELLPLWAWTLTGASFELCNEGVGGRISAPVTTGYQVSPGSLWTSLAPHSPIRQCPGL